MYSDYVDGRLSNKVLGVHFRRPFEIPAACLLNRPFFPFLVFVLSPSAATEPLPFLDFGKILLKTRWKFKLRKCSSFAN